MVDPKEHIPHREPFLFVDGVTEFDEKKVVAYRTFKDDEFFFKGHFPEYPIVPGVILIESMAQCGGVGIGAAGLLKNMFFFLVSIEKAKFRRQVRPNEKVRFEIENLRVSKRMVRQRGKAFVGDELAAEAEWLCLVADSPPE